jgi:hypothetical protein
VTATKPTIQACRNAGCPAAQGGACALGEEDPLDCEQVTLAPPAAGKEKRKCDPGHNLGVTEATTVLNDRAVPVVAIVAKNHAGKTTLLGRLMAELGLRSDGLRGCTFKDSRTLMGFQARMSAVAVLNGTRYALQPRSVLDMFDILHLELVGHDGKPFETLWVDAAGELYDQRLTTGKKAWSELPFFKRATHVVVMLALDRLNKPEERHEIFDSAKVALDMAIASATWGKGQHLVILFSKADRFQDNAKLQAFLKHVEQEVRNRYAENFASISFRQFQSLGEGERVAQSLAWLLNSIRPGACSPSVADQVTA